MPNRAATRLLMLGVLLGWVGPGRVAGAMILYDEATAGDLGGQLLGVHLATLAIGDGLSVTGSLDAGAANDGPDTYDTFSLTTLGTWDLSVTSVTLGSNPDGLMVFLYGVSDGGFAFLDAQADGGPDSAPSASLFGPLDAGTYAITLAPVGNVGSLSYAVGVEVGEMSADQATVPGPASLALGGLAFPGCLLMARGRRRPAA